MGMEGRRREERVQGKIKQLRGAVISKGVYRARETLTAEELEDQAGGDSSIHQLQDCHSPSITHKLLGTSHVFMVLWDVEKVRVVLK